MDCFTENTCDSMTSFLTCIVFEFEIIQSKRWKFLSFFLATRKKISQSDVWKGDSAFSYFHTYLLLLPLGLYLLLASMFLKSAFSFVSTLQPLSLEFNTNARNCYFLQFPKYKYKGLNKDDRWNSTTYHSFVIKLRAETSYSNEWIVNIDITQLNVAFIVCSSKKIFFLPRNIYSIDWTHISHGRCWLEMKHHRF